VPSKSRRQPQNALSRTGGDQYAAAAHNFSLQTFGAGAYIAWIGTLLGYGIWTYLISRYPTNRIAPFTMLVPLFGLTVGWLMFSEELKPVHFAGGYLLMIGQLVNLFEAPLFTRLHHKWISANSDL
jgi:O-acetylserine/cysteine efflux transporter